MSTATQLNYARLFSPLFNISYAHETNDDHHEIFFLFACIPYEQEFSISLTTSVDHNWDFDFSTAWTHMWKHHPLSSSFVFYQKRFSTPQQPSPDNSNDRCLWHPNIHQVKHLRGVRSLETLGCLFIFQLKTTTNLKCRLLEFQSGMCVCGWAISAIIKLLSFKLTLMFLFHSFDYFLCRD